MWKQKRKQSAGTFSSQKLFAEPYSHFSLHFENICIAYNLKLCRKKFFHQIFRLFSKCRKKRVKFWSSYRLFVLPICVLSIKNMYTRKMPKQMTLVKIKLEQYHFLNFLNAGSIRISSSITNFNQVPDASL